MPCERWANHGLISREEGVGGPCGQPTLPGERLCPRHQAEDDYGTRALERAMANASRHVEGMGIFGEGTWCDCGAFVKDNTNHPFGLPWQVEDEKVLGGLRPCPACAYRWRHPDLNINCGAGCEDGWVPIHPESDPS